MKRFYYIFLILAVGCLKTTGQTGRNTSHELTITIPEVALIDLETSSTTAISLNPAAPNEAGMAVDFTNITNNDIWINYSSIAGQNASASRSVSATVNGELPRGVKLNVAASAYSGDGDGNLGIPVGTVELTDSPREVIANIGSCYTGDGVNKGHRLTYSLELDEAAGYESLAFNESSMLTVTYTLSDNN